MMGRILSKAKNTTLSLGQLQQLAHTTCRREGIILNH
jgi:hypothetical protein